MHLFFSLKVYLMLGAVHKDIRTKFTPHATFFCNFVRTQHIFWKILTLLQQKFGVHILKKPCPQNDRNGQTPSLITTDVFYGQHLTWSYFNVYFRGNKL